MHITSDIKYIGVNDHQIDLFESQYTVPNGMAYNSYAVIDEKIAIVDSVDVHFTAEWLQNIKNALGDRQPDYLIVQHMEPDHSGSLTAFMAAYPQAIVVATSKAFAMMLAFFGEDYPSRRRMVKEGDVLTLGKHALTFITAPMVHWPEVMVTYDQHDKVLFSADAFGKFGALDANEDWAEEARRYYIGIVGKYGAQVQQLLKKAAMFEIEAICPLHGPMLQHNLSYYVDLYSTWASYSPESKGVTVAYSSVYGNTKLAAETLAAQLREMDETVALHDLSRCDMAQAVADAFRYDRLVLATTTYNMDVFPRMNAFIHHLTERNFQKRTIGLIENGSWAPAAAKVMRTLLSGCKELAFTETTVRIVSALNDESRAQLNALVNELSC